MREACDAAGVVLVTGDTKVVDRGKGDGVFITTTGVGVVPVVTWPWRRRPRVELTGWVRSREMRDAAVLVVEREARKLGRSVRIIDSLEVIDRQQQRGA